jgi:hypothetical protein
MNNKKNQHRRSVETLELSGNDDKKIIAHNFVKFTGKGFHYVKKTKAERISYE